jgi:hypothetical protein
MKLSRKEVARRFKCTEATIQKLEAEGRLKATRDKPAGQHGRVWYESDEVERLKKEWTPRRNLPERVDSKLVERNVRGKVAAMVFRILDARRGQDVESLFRAIVIETEADPLLVREIIGEWELGVAKARIEKEKRRREAEEKEAQRLHDKRAREETFREWKLKLAKIEAGKSKGT